ncbi:hypothetical protein [Granulicella tundricola]|uniref:DUF1641 domain-containing protein n=1 Tax=Granulicella tundricola (strain ATCC BAA-1859 / DSM 23138 / MP5ACTX9) TaxID=1198114 RepID=E8X6P7_GRATM|nr:hypothetical protein [Granulicella tundricola]ADW71197.1 hypothetical protein AciX9_3921 [Granulicella tundricola MP5ACTX9]
MAVAVDFRVYTPVDAREDLLKRVSEAPVQHAEAVLAAFEVLEKLHEKDVLSTINGLLGAKDTVINHVAGLVSSKEMINILRLSLLAGNLVKDIDPDALHGVLKEAQGTPPSFFQIGKRMLSPDARRAMGVFGGILNVFGAALKKKDEA